MEVLNENIPEKVFENVNLHSSLESIDNSKCDDELADSGGEKLTGSKRNSLKRFFFKKNDELTTNEDVPKESKSTFGSFGRRIYAKPGKAPEFASTIPKREHGQMNLVEGAELDGNPKQKSLTNLKSTVSLYWQSIFSKKKDDAKEPTKTENDNDSGDKTGDSEAAKVLIDS